MALGYKYSWAEIDSLIQNWKTFALEQSGEFKAFNVHSHANIYDSTLKKFELIIPFLDGQISFLTTELKPLKISYTFNKSINDEFLIYPEDFTDRISKLFGVKEIEIGDTVFDKNFIVKGKNKIFLNELLSKEVKDYLLNNSIANFKQEKSGTNTILELNVAINELDNNNLKEVLSHFKACILLIHEKKN